MNDINSLIQALDDPDHGRRSKARDQLVAVGPGAVEALLMALETDNIRLSWQAALVLSDIPDPRWLGPMGKALTSQNILLGQAAVEALEKAIPNEAVDLFIEALPHSRLMIQLALIKALERLQDKRSIGPLCQLLRDTQSSEVRYTVIETLGAIGDTSIIPLLKSYQNDANHHVRERVEVALGGLGKQ